MLYKSSTQFNILVLVVRVFFFLQMVAQLKDHLLRPLQYVGKKKIDQIAVDYVSKLVGFFERNKTK